MLAKILEARVKALYDELEEQDAKGEAIAMLCPSAPKA
jgi:hypothetical protein